MHKTVKWRSRAVERLGTATGPPIEPLSWSIASAETGKEERKTTGKKIGGRGDQEGWPESNGWHSRSHPSTAERKSCTSRVTSHITVELSQGKPGSSDDNVRVQPSNLMGIPLNFPVATTPTSQPTWYPSQCQLTPPP